MDSRLPRLSMAIPIALLVVLALASVAHATFQGENGKLAFIRYHPDENADLWTVNADGSGLTRLTDNEVFGSDSAYDSSPSWSPNGRKILFERYREMEGASGIFTINPDGSALTQLDDFRGSAAWLPDGRVALSKWEPEAGLYFINADGTGKTRVGPGADGAALSWSPDATRFAYTGWSLAGYEVWVSSTDGSDVRKILQLRLYESPNPIWYPGPRIAFTRRGDGHHFDLWTMNADGTEQVRLTDGETSALVHKWSPDGTRFLFLSDRNAAPGDVFDVFTIAADGTRLMNLTPSSTSTENNADWSPDGRLVAFSGSEEGADGMFTVDTAGRDRARLTTTVGEEHDDHLDWQPLQRSSFRNAAAFCRAQREAVGSRLFSLRYGKARGAGAFGRCVRGEG